MSEERDRSLADLAELSVLLPLGLAGTIVDALPDAARRARHEIILARFVGKLTVDQALRELRRRLESESTNGARPAASAARPIESSGAGTPGDEAAVDPADDARLVDAPSSVPAVESLALPDYDQLPAAHIVAKLSGLTEGERADIEAYERSNRGRRTVLNKLAQLA